VRHDHEDGAEYPCPSLFVFSTDFLTLLQLLHKSSTSSTSSRAFRAAAENISKRDWFWWDCKVRGAPLKFLMVGSRPVHRSSTLANKTSRNAPFFRALQGKPQLRAWTGLVSWTRWLPLVHWVRHLYFSACGRFDFSHPCFDRYSSLFGCRLVKILDFYLA